MPGAMIERDLRRSLGATACCLLHKVHIAPFGNRKTRSGRPDVKSPSIFGVLLFPLFATLSACGGGGSMTGVPGSSGGGSGTFLPASNFDKMCVAPRPGTSDQPGTVTDQNNWLRSW